ncbi:sugar transferase [Gammaproteobacteria bacterium]|nr:sugar transferase [Gammaproteobacteria bacterium]
MKRSLDILFSFFALLIFIPFLLPVIIILRLTGEGEIFYIQERVGRGGNLFGLYKFATMLKNSPNIGTGEITVRSDPRVLPFGKLLRKTKLNELPQLWNILIGDMSVVGPRPMVPNIYDYYPQAARHKLNTVRPGLSGIGSIIFRDEERYLIDHDEPMKFYREYIIPYKSNLELWFVENNSLWLYIKIIFVTVWVVVFSSSTIANKAFAGIPKLPESLIK